MSNFDDILNILLSSDNSDNNKNNGNDESGKTDSFDDLLGGIDIEMIMKIGEIMSKLNEHDKNTDLLYAIKPYLRDENQSKIDIAVKLFRLISLLPYLKDSGLFEKIF